MHVVKSILSEDNINKLKRHLETIKIEKDLLELKIKDLDAMINYTFSKMGFRERYLAGFLGGNRELVKEYKILNIKREKLKKALLEKDDAVKNIRNEIHNILHNTLLKNDPTYKKLNELYKHYSQSINDTNILLNLIDEAISSIRSAQSSETLDLASNNIAFSLMSSGNISAANEAVKKVVNYIPKFQKSIEALQKKIDKKLANKEIDTSDIKEIEDDFICDLVFPDISFDIFSINTLSELENMENKINSIYKQVKKIKESLILSQQKIKERQNEIINFYKDKY